MAVARRRLLLQRMEIHLCYIQRCPSCPRFAIINYFSNVVTFLSTVVCELCPCSTCALPIVAVCWKASAFLDSYYFLPWRPRKKQSWRSMSMSIREAAPPAYFLGHCTISGGGVGGGGGWGHRRRWKTTIRLLSFSSPRWCSWWPFHGVAPWTHGYLSSLARDSAPPLLRLHGRGGGRHCEVRKKAPLRCSSATPHQAPLRSRHGRTRI